MPREDDDALGQMLGDRLQGTKGKSEDDEVNDTETSGEESEAKSASGRNSVESATQESAESTQITQSTDDTDTTNTTLEGSKKDTESRSTTGTVRSRSPFPLYVTPELKESVQNRFEKFNAQRTLNDEPQVEKHKHFMEGLLRAGLEHPDLEEYVLNEFDDS